MGARNHSYRNHKTEELVIATRITKINMKSAHGVPHARATGDDKNESYAVATKDGDVSANPGDWVVANSNGNISVMTHADFAAAHCPAD